MASTSLLFSVVLSTHRRGKHIEPTIESVLRQTCSDFELIVVGDGCTDETAEFVHSYSSRGVRWCNLEQNSGSQSFPNNLGIQQAAGKWIAYLGHDDIWSPNHLAALQMLIDSRPDCDFAISGCIYYGPQESGVYLVTGLFDSPETALTQFFPPSSLAHRRDVVDRIGWWRDPRDVAPPVDAEFLLRAADAGLQFASTHAITAHKFAAGHRYLSSLGRNAEEQWNALEQAIWNSPDRVQAIVDQATAQGRFMTSFYPDHSQHEPGELFTLGRRNKGILRPEVKAVEGRIVVEQTGEPRALDWYRLRSGDRPYRWSGPNPRAKILIPYTSKDPVRMTLCVPAIEVPPLSDVRIELNGQRVGYTIQPERKGHRLVISPARLNESDYSILTVHTPQLAYPKEPTKPRGIDIGDIIIEAVG